MIDFATPNSDMNDIAAEFYESVPDNFITVKLVPWYDNSLEIFMDGLLVMHIKAENYDLEFIVNPGEREYKIDPKNFYLEFKYNTDIELGSINIYNHYLIVKSSEISFLRSKIKTSGNVVYLRNGIIEQLIDYRLRYTG